jgi:hypothetical protein
VSQDVVLKKRKLQQCSSVLYAERRTAFIACRLFSREVAREVAKHIASGDLFFESRKTEKSTVLTSLDIFGILKRTLILQLHQTTFSPFR